MNRRARQVISALKALPRFRIALPGATYNHFDLLEVDYRYGKMFRLHESAHSRMIEEAGNRQFSSVLEVACGAGWNVPLFKKAGVEYWGMDISETAIAAAALKYPENRYLNLGIMDTKPFADGSFDLVYNSSMLEHIGYFREAIIEMVRLARREAWILFFEGLTDRAENETSFHPYTPEQISGKEKDVYGRKVVLQDHLVNARKGWYWNRYAKAAITDIFRGTDYAIEILDRTNRPFLADESVLIVRKSPA